MQVADIQREILKCMSELQVLQRRKIPSHSSHVQSWLGSDAGSELKYGVNDDTVSGWVMFGERKIDVKIDTCANIERDKFELIFKMKAFIDWCTHLDSKFFTMTSFKTIYIQNLDIFGPRVGFLKFKTDMKYNNGNNIPNVTFMRGGSVAILMLLHCIETGKVYSIIVMQPRVPVGKAELAEIPAGMIDNDSNFTGTAAKEIKEETGIAVQEAELVDRTVAAKLEDANHPGIYPSPGGCDEYIKFYLYRKCMPENEILELEGRLTGNIEEGEEIKLNVIPLDELAARCPDMKTLTALYLYSCIPESVRLPKGLGIARDLSTLTISDNLVISTGDISDVDGFMALAKYAQLGCDVMFIMNYPAYLNVGTFENKLMQVGSGYRYGTDTLLNETIKKRDCSMYASYLNILRRYGIADIDGVFGSENARVKQILTDLAFEMATKVWRQASARGALYFCVGGINDVNPFSASAVKNEMLVYSECVQQMVQLGTSKQHCVFYGDGRKFVCGPRDILGSYASIYVDFNGSMAFLDDYWCDVIKRVSTKIKAAVVMGGVYCHTKPTTSPSIPNVLNRISCATMNQLYSPAKTAAFFELMKGNKIPVYVVANNAVCVTLDTFSDPGTRGTKTDDGWNKFLNANGIYSEKLRDYCKSYYTDSPYNAPRKPFDFYTALVMSALLKPTDVKGVGFQPNPLSLCYDDKLGVTLVGYGPTLSWENIVTKYVHQLDTQITQSDDESTVRRKKSFESEVAVLFGLKYQVLQVCAVHPVMDKDTFVVTL